MRLKSSSKFIGKKSQSNFWKGSVNDLYFDENIFERMKTEEILTTTNNNSEIAQNKLANERDKRNK